MSEKKIKNVRYPCKFQKQNEKKIFNYQNAPVEKFKKKILNHNNYLNIFLKI